MLLKIKAIHLGLVLLYLHASNKTISFLLTSNFFDFHSLIVDTIGMSTYINYAPLMAGIKKYLQDNTMASLSRASGISNPTLSRIVAGYIKKPTLDTWLSLHNASPACIPPPPVADSQEWEDRLNALGVFFYEMSEIKELGGYIENNLFRLKNIPVFENYLADVKKFLHENLSAPNYEKIKVKLTEITTVANQINLIAAHETRSREACLNDESKKKVDSLIDKLRIKPLSNEQLKSITCEWEDFFNHNEEYQEAMDEWASEAEYLRRDSLTKLIELPTSRQHTIIKKILSLDEPGLYAIEAMLNAILKTKTDGEP